MTCLILLLYVQTASWPQMQTGKHLLRFHSRWFCVLGVVRMVYVILTSIEMEPNWRTLLNIPSAFVMVECIRIGQVSPKMPADNCIWSHFVLVKTNSYNGSLNIIAFILSLAFSMKRNTFIIPFYPVNALYL